LFKEPPRSRESREERKGREKKSFRSGIGEKCDKMKKGE
jgi:hypothetical protein